MADPISMTIAVAALGVSVLTSWANLLRRGSIRLTKPAFIAFCYDVGGDGRIQPKVFIRALLYSTGRRGQVVENMYLIVRCNETQQTFSIWGHGDEKLSRGSGLFVGETGLVTNHHFNPPSSTSPFHFLPGSYEIRVFATLVGRRNPIPLCTATVSVPEGMKRDIESPGSAVWFDWEPAAHCYEARIETRQNARLAGLMEKH